MSVGGGGEEGGRGGVGWRWVMVGRVAMGAIHIVAVCVCGGGGGEGEERLSELQKSLERTIFLDIHLCVGFSPDSEEDDSSCDNYHHYHHYHDGHYCSDDCIVILFLGTARDCSGEGRIHQRKKEQTNLVNSNSETWLTAT